MATTLMEANRFIYRKSCNDYLDLTGLNISETVWRGMERLLISGAIFPPIHRIDITNSNITFDMVDDRLKPLIVRR